MIENLHRPYARVIYVALITLGSIMMSLAITCIALLVQGEPIRLSVMIIAFTAPLLIAPVVSWHLTNLLIELHRMEQEMRQHATYDELTGVYNRRAFLTSAEQAMQFVQRNRHSIALLYLDIDNFKKINDTHGHVVGDAALRNFAAILKHLKRESDLLGRLGGEEFAIMITNTDRAGAHHFAEKILKAVRNSIALYHDIAIRNTVSIGLAISSHDQRCSLDELVHQADEALYEAKHSGKDRVVIHDESISQATRRAHASGQHD